MAIGPAAPTNLKYTLSPPPCVKSPRLSEYFSALVVFSNNMNRQFVMFTNPILKIWNINK